MDGDLQDVARGLRAVGRDAQRALVVVAEDDPEMRRMLALALRRDGHRVRELEHGAAVLAALSADAVAADGRPDLIVSDIRMPGVGGLDLVSGLRARGVELPVILITAFGDADVHAKGRRLGATDVVDKPFDLGVFRRLVRFRLEQARGHRAQLEETHEQSTRAV